MLDVIVPLKMLIDVNSKQFAKFNTSSLEPLPAMLGSYSSRSCTLDICGVDSFITLLSLLKARVLSSDQTFGLLIDW